MVKEKSFKKRVKKLISLILSIILVLAGTNWWMIKGVKAEGSYTLKINSYDITDTSISDINYFSYTTDGEHWIKIAAVNTTGISNVKAIKLTLNSNYQLDSNTSIVTVTNNNVTNINISDILTTLKSNNGYTLSGTVDSFEISHINFVSNTSNNTTQNQPANLGVNVINFNTTDSTILNTNYFSYTTNGNDWITITTSDINRTISGATAIKLTLADGYSVANHTAFRDNGTDVLHSNLSTFTSNSGYSLNSSTNYSLENIDFVYNTSGNNNPGYSFNGTIYLTWVANNNFYYHKISGLTTNDPTTLQTKSIAEMKADNDDSIIFEIGNSYEFCYKSFGDLIDTNDATGNTYTNSDFNSATANQKLSMLRELDLTIDPTGAVSTSNSISTNGDRAFRLAIYTENCKAFTISGSGNYTINAEDQILTNSTVDLSDSTVSNPAEVNSFILNDTVNIVANNIGSTTTSIDSIEAVNVANSNAITINNTTGQVTFNSNFYNNVTFKITDTDNKAYYVKVNRYDMLISDSLVPGDTNNRIYSNVYYSKSLVGKVAVQVRIVKNDGSVEITNATLSSTTHLPNGDVVEQNYVDGSTGSETITSDIAMSTFYIDKTNVKDAYFTVIDTTNNSVLSGSGYGLRFNVATRSAIY
ncbi:hypothetical protein [Lachnospira multipara]|uniref:Uncharacterized protein n=1 Tax=Lachnospira multipara TaxID=28051 RepID=A0A1H5U4Z3_9FIRM|nr:hypothetical protein [Lachnospira multipara]SEF69347.1 hypothetical protein SAMN05216537_10644 [Lachnospira multipara]